MVLITIYFVSLNTSATIRRLERLEVYNKAVLNCVGSLFKC